MDIVGQLEAQQVKKDPSTLRPGELPLSRA